MAATRKEQQMNPLITDKFLKATFLAVAALVLAAPAGARPIIGDNELGDTAGTVVTSQAVAPDAVDRAVAIEASKADEGVVVLRKSGTVVVTGKQQPAWYTALMARSQAMNEFYAAQQAEPAWYTALMARSQAMNEFYGAGNAEPQWLTALNARSEAMNEFYGAGGSATAIHPNDRAVPRPVSQQPLLSAPSSGNGTEWGNI
ncbi:MAG TPA: hypothetical protein VH950_15850, partial [Gaiellaceae bacterium]